jgi:thiamine phosphate synthase YjbQ (UPF0047 family)
MYWPSSIVCSMLKKGAQHETNIKRNRDRKSVEHDVAFSHLKKSLFMNQESLPIAKSAKRNGTEQECVSSKLSHALNSLLTMCADRVHV